jgi:hypothetical protein
MMNLVVQIAGKPAAPLPEASLEASSKAGPDTTAVELPAADITTSVPPAAADSPLKESETGNDKAPTAEAAGAVVTPEAGPAKPTDAPKPADPATTMIGAAVPVPPKTPVEDALAPRSEQGVDQMIRQTPAGSIFVQHVSLNSMAEAQEWRAQYGALSGARIAAVTTQNKGVRYVVISGPFASMKEAETFTRKEGVPSEPWLRPVNSLQRALQTANR